ncbi:MAG TPA: 2-oxoglutarate and iron-dependent oxygenase domain-containing protein [Oligoflexia bacterium]|nr:2-oxoglutarate and iron-dependent oxygenase domain-containing protein [Oligoflexia bacterium]HMR25104.1 2-oxoglutarate and iron-dependent oxygenase domain-containing protein [Oligoflexia bacterium]
MYVEKVSLKDPRAKYQLLESFKNTGFAVLVDHPIDAQLIEDSYTAWKDFFASPAKHDYLFNPETQDGYFPMLSENAKGQALPDLKEFFHYYPHHRIPNACQHITQNLHQELISLAHTLLHWLDEVLPQNITQNLSQSLSSMARDSQQTLMRPIHYPPVKDDALLKQGAIRAAAHEDINLITLLPAASAPGLQVKDTQGNWHDVSCDPGMIAVNVGDMLQEATGGHLPSTTHQVINPEQEAMRSSRYSIPLFVHAKPEVVLSKRYTAKSYLDERLREIGLK